MLRKSRDKIGGSILNKKDIRGPVRGTKTPFLLEYETKIEKKLTSLKAVINQKKQQDKHRLSARQKTTIQSTIVEKDPEIQKFLAKIGMHHYMDKIVSNGIDSFQLFQQIKQQQLQEIGIPKGHALKIAVHLKKEIQQKEQKFKSVTTPNTNTTTRKYPDKTVSETKQIKIQNKGIVAEKHQIKNDSSSCQESFPLNCKYFCLFCYARSQQQFCSSRCQQLYDRMFAKYEQNLVNAEKMFCKVKTPKEDLKEQENSENSFLCFMNENQMQHNEVDYMNEEQYEQVRNDLMKLKFEDNQ